MHLVEPKKGWANILKKASMRRLIDFLAEKNIIPATERFSLRQQLALSPDTTTAKLMEHAASKHLPLCI
ncbi:hypothetical protein [Brenneria uluponensis]|uniref:hypothetical protein n=1 Tax=Brenneria uluponensis TaxID=3057057 RepID=UPI0028E9F602|nr:hypothetical protein [Brenneria ulupoensis]